MKTTHSMPSMTTDTDVLIMGGGLSGMTLALQLRKRMPTLRVMVLERNAHPVPVAAHKVGESTVEIGAHYLADTLGLREHLDKHHLRKFGFRFFFSDGRSDIDQTTELGASRYLSAPTYQIDRGMLENHLGQTVQAQGMAFHDNAVVQTVAMSEDKNRPHAVTWQDRRDNPKANEASDGAALPAPPVHTTTARWVIDASGRAGLLKRKFQLAEGNDHGAHAIWFRMNHRINVDAWSQDSTWQQRCVKPERWLSTNHLCGPGYWLWLIPLGSGSHSVGIVADPRLQPLEGMNTFERAMDWIKDHQPRLYQELDPVRDTLQDFAFFKSFSYGCKQVFSDQRWAITGEAGRFLDPFYSPGSDFIAIGNTYITQLVADDMAGKDIRGQARIYDSTIRTFYESMLPIYQDQYALFGDAEVMPVKVIWDYAYYWSVLAPLFFHERLTDVALLAYAQSDLNACRRLNEQVQAFFRQWNTFSSKQGSAQMFDQCRVDWFVELNRQLTVAKDAQAVRADLHQAAKLLAQLAQEIAGGAMQRHVGLADDAQLLLASVALAVPSSATAVATAAGQPAVKPERETLLHAL
jgi:flavin-dependent dehydrogenase